MLSFLQAWNIIDAVQRGRRLDRLEREFLVEQMLDTPLLSIRGRLAKSTQAKASDADVQAYWRAEWRRAKAEGKTAEEARNFATHKTLRHFKNYKYDRSPKAVAKRMQRRQRVAKIAAN
jgi:hypothetical protein